MTVFSRARAESLGFYIDGGRNPRMFATAQRFDISVSGRPHTVDVRRNDVLDRAEILVDGNPVTVATRRRMFSYLWRYAFAIDGTPVEVRAYTASGKSEMSIAVGDALAEPVKHTAASRGAFIVAAVMAAVFCGRMVFWSGSVPLAVRLAIGGGAFVVVAGVGLFVYRRSAD